jgi:hypothetical protein
MTPAYEGDGSAQGRSQRTVVPAAGKAGPTRRLDRASAFPSVIGILTALLCARQRKLSGKHIYRARSVLRNLAVNTRIILIQLFYQCD